MSCLLDHPAEALASTGPTAAAECAGAGLDLAGAFESTWPAIEVHRLFTVPRARATWELSEAPARARLVLDATRSGGPDGYVGIDGNAVVPIVEAAEARLDAPRIGLAGGAGIIDTAWTRIEDELWDLPTVAPPLGQSTGWLTSSDLGGWVAWSSVGRVAQLRVEMTSGEGTDTRERNNGQDLAAVATARPIDHLELSAWARDGSTALGLVRDHRAGGLVGWQSKSLVAGAEVLAVWGLDGDAARQPIGASMFVRVRPVGSLWAFARVDPRSEVPADPRAGALEAWAGIDLGLPWDAAEPPCELLVGAQHNAIGPDARAVAGASALATETMAYAQLRVHLDWSTPTP